MRTLVLDLDGTLVDSVPDIAASVNRLLAARLLPGLQEHEVAAMVGDGTAALIERVFAARGAEPDLLAEARYVEDYTLRCTEATAPFPGIPEVLRALVAGGWTLAVCTNKPEAAALRVLRAVGLDGLVAAVSGGDGAHRKPDPRHMLDALGRAGGSVEAAVAVGDHRNDVLAARGAGIPAVFVAWGYGTAEMAAGAAAVAQRVGDLPGLADGLLRG